MKILLAADGSERSVWAARFLARLRLSPSDNIAIFHTIDWMPFQYDEDFYFGTLKELKDRLAPNVLNPVLEILSSTNAVKSVALDDGPPEQYIAEAAANMGSDIIVMGSGRLPGSVTKAVAANSTKPVIVVKGPPGLKPENMKILFATDGSEHSLATEGVLSQVPFAEDTEVMVLKVAADEKDMGSEAIVRNTADHLRKRFRKVTTRLQAGTPSSEILKAAEETGADLIAVGCRGLTGIKKMLGSVSCYVLNHSTCSVLIGKTCG